MRRTDAGRLVAAALTILGLGAAPPAFAQGLGPAPDGQRLALRVVLEPRDPAALAAFVDAVSDPASPRYSNHLGPGEFAERFGPAPSTVAAVRSALRDAGLEPGAASRSGLVIPVTGTVAEAEAAFRTTIDRVRAPSGGTAIAHASAPRFPTGVAGVVGLDTRAQAHPKARLRAAAAAPTACAAADDAAAASDAHTMDGFATAYGFDALYGPADGGAGVTIALPEFEPYSASDLQAFQDCYGLQTSIADVDVNGGPTGAAGGEATLDVQVAAALAPGADLRVYQAPDPCVARRRLLAHRRRRDRAGRAHELGRLRARAHRGPLRRRAALPRPRPAVTLHGARVTPGGRVELPFACPRQAVQCVVDVTLRRAGRTVARAKGRRILPGRTRRILLTPRRGSRRVVARLTLVARFAGGATRRTTATVTLRPPA